ncbi:MAG TPA: hypothetical protein VJ692_07210 [Nitrospiraceae bacterium]|nr:hypothetical protein [Nitrospiraceae bacterium]
MTHGRFYPGDFSGSAYGSVGCADSSGCVTSRVFLIAIRGGLLPPMFPGSSLLQRMRIILAGSGDSAMNNWSEPVVGPLPEVSQPAGLSIHASARGKLQPRLVQGELLCDESGRFYEKLGHRVRPLHKLASGPNRELLDLMPVGDVNPAAPDERGFNVQYDMTEQPSESTRNLGGPAEYVEACRTSQDTPTSSKASYRTLVSDPGLWRVLRWGDFKELLACQVAHPERLRDAHRLPCYVQVYEATVAQSLESLAGTVLKDATQAAQFRPLTPALASKLGLIEVIETHAAIPVYGRHQPGVLKPYERAFRLQIAHDPTKDEPARPQNALFGGGRFDVGQNSSRLGGLHGEPAGLKTRIPERFLKPWEFKLSREEVLYDMDAGAGGSGSLGNWIRRLKVKIAARREYRKWQTLLQGKHADEQLWSVRPPRECWRQGNVREWAQRTLQLAGYDPRVMLTEWEVFWRRKGL